MCHGLDQYGAGPKFEQQQFGAAAGVEGVNTARHHRWTTSVLTAEMRRKINEEQDSQDVWSGTGAGVACILQALAIHYAASGVTLSLK